MTRRFFLLPHPDDEFAVSVFLADAVKAGDAVQVVYLTDGGYLGQDVAARESESLAVLARLGVPASSVVFLGRQHGFPDGALHRHLERAEASLQALFAEVGEPDVMYLPAWEGGHQDHDAGHLLGISAAKPTVELRQFPLYQGAGLPGPFFRVMTPLAENGQSVRRVASFRERARQMGICLSFPSQWKTWIGLTPFVLLHLVMDGGFHLQPVDPARTLAKPHPGRLLYERRGVLGWNEFLQATEQFRAALLAARGVQRERP